MDGRPRSGRASLPQPTAESFSGRFARLPEETISVLTEFLSVTDLASLGTTSRECKRLTRTVELWTRRLLLDFQLPILLEGHSARKTYKLCYDARKQRLQRAADQLDVRITQRNNARDRERRRAYMWSRFLPRRMLTSLDDDDFAQLMRIVHVGVSVTSASVALCFRSYLMPLVVSCFSWWSWWLSLGTPCLLWLLLLFVILVRDSPFRTSIQPLFSFRGKCVICVLLIPVCVYVEWSWHPSLTWLLGRFLMRTVIPFVPPALLGFLLLKYEASDRLSAVLRRWLPARLSGSSSLRGILDMLSFFISFVCVGVGTGLYVVLLEKQLICLQFCLVSAVLTVIRAPMVVGIASLGWSLGRLARTPHSGAVQDAAAGCGLFAFFPLLWEAMTYFIFYPDASSVVYFSFHYLAIQALRAGVMASDMVKVVCNVYLVLEMLLKLAARLPRRGRFELHDFVSIRSVCLATFTATILGAAARFALPLLGVETGTEWEAVQAIALGPVWKLGRDHCRA